MIVRRATIEDGKEIFAIEAECFSVPWSLDSIETELSNQDNLVIFSVATFIKRPLILSLLTIL